MTSDAEILAACQRHGLGALDTFRVLSDPEPWLALNKRVCPELFA